MPEPGQRMGTVVAKTRSTLHQAIEDAYATYQASIAANDPITTIQSNRDALRAAQTAYWDAVEDALFAIQAGTFTDVAAAALAFGVERGDIFR